MRRSAVFFLGFVLLLSPLLVRSLNGAAPLPHMFIVPAESAARLEQEFQIRINITSTVGVSSWEFYINFDPALLHLSAYEEGDFLKRSGSPFPIVAYNRSLYGFVQLGQAMNGPETSSGNGTLALLSFTVHDEGNCTFHLTNTTLLDVNLNSISHTTSDASFHALPPFIGTVCVNMDGSVSPSDAPIERSGNTYALTGNITSSTDGLIVHRSGAIISGSGYAIRGSGFGRGCWVSSVADVGIQSLDVRGFDFGVMFENSSGCKITDSSVVDCGHGIHILMSTNSTFSGNTVESNYVGFLLNASSSNDIVGNLIRSNDQGLLIDSSSNNRICQNRFIGNVQQASAHYSFNQLDDGYPFGGNYWDDYEGADLFKGVFQDEAGSDGIGDTPYIVSSGNIDYYPLVFSLPTFTALPNHVTAKPGTYFDISINVVNVEHLYGYQVYVGFSPQILEVTAIVQGDFLSRGAYKPFWVPKCNNTRGVVAVWESMLNPEPDVSGSGELFTICFLAKNVGISSLDLSDVQMYNQWGAPTGPINVIGGSVACLSDGMVYAIPWETRVFQVLVDSNSSISSVNFTQYTKSLSFDVDGPDGTDGYAIVVIPRTLLSASVDDWTLLIDSLPIEAKICENATHTFLYFTYGHSVHRIEIKGTTVIPEFTTPVLHLLLISLLGLPFLRRKRHARS